MDKKEVFKRDYSVRSDAINVEDRTVELSFSSELPVTREMWGNTVTEILDHSPSSVDLSRLKDGAALLFNHNRDLMLGVVLNARIDKDRIGRANVKFGNTDAAMQAWKDVQEGILTKVSVAYSIDEVKETKTDNAIEVRAMKWTPLEISMVSVPFDPTVGVGRSADDTIVHPANPEGKQDLKVEVEVAPEGQPKTETSIETGRKLPTITINTRNKNEGKQMNELEVMKEERKRINEIDAITERFEKEVDGIRELRNKAIEESWNLEQYRSTVLQNLKQKEVTATPGIGLTEKEKKEYSISRAILSAVPGSGVDNCFEREVSNEMGRKSGQPSKGLYVPYDIRLRGVEYNRLAWSVQDAANAGNTVATDLLGGSFIELLRNRTVLDKVGATFMPGLVGNVAIPRQKSASTAYWMAENGSITVSTGSVDQVTLSPKIVGAYSDFSRKLLAQSTPQIDNLIQTDIATVIAIEIDRAALTGSGTANQPTGVARTASVYSASLATGSWANVVTLETQVAAANADIGSMAYVTSCTIAGGLKTATKLSVGTATAYPVFVLDGAMLNGYPLVRSNQVNGNLYFGNWQQLIVGMWGPGIELIIDPYSLSLNNNIRIVANSMVDVGVRQPGAFAYAYGMAYFG